MGGRDPGTQSSVDGHSSQTALGDVSASDLPSLSKTHMAPCGTAPGPRALLQHLGLSSWAPCTAGRLPISVSHCAPCRPHCPHVGSACESLPEGHLEGRLSSFPSATPSRPPRCPRTPWSTAPLPPAPGTAAAPGRVRPAGASDHTQCRPAAVLCPPGSGSKLASAKNYEAPVQLAGRTIRLCPLQQTTYFYF